MSTSISRFMADSTLEAVQRLDAALGDAPVSEPQLAGFAKAGVEHR